MDFNQTFAPHSTKYTYCCSEWQFITYARGLSNLFTSWTRVTTVLREKSHSPMGPTYKIKYRYNSTLCQSWVEMIHSQLKSFSSGLRVPIASIFRGQFLLPSIPGMITWKIARKAKQTKKARTTEHTVYSMATWQK